MSTQSNANNPECIGSANFLRTAPHWLRVKERIKFKLCVLTHRCLHGTAPTYLAEKIHQTTDVDARRRLRSADSSLLLVPRTFRSTLGDRAFPVAALCAWNSLPRDRLTVSLPSEVKNTSSRTHLPTRCSAGVATATPPSPGSASIS